MLIGSYQMDKHGMRKGQSYEVVVLQGERVLGAVEHEIISDDQCATNIFVKDDGDLVALYEAVNAAAAAIDFHMHKPTLRALVEERIAELRDKREGAEGEPPYPNDVTDIPF